jgi:hypothetical protein
MASSNSSFRAAEAQNQMASEHNIIQEVEEDDKGREVIRHLVGWEECRDHRKSGVCYHDNEETRGISMKTNLAIFS